MTRLECNGWPSRKDDRYKGGICCCWSEHLVLGSTDVIKETDALDLKRSIFSTFVHGPLSTDKLVRELHSGSTVKPGNVVPYAIVHVNEKLL